MNCLSCANLTTKPRVPADPRACTSQATMARNGFASCIKLPAYVYVSATIERQCGMYAQAPDEQMAARRKWAES